MTFNTYLAAHFRLNTVRLSVIPAHLEDGGDEWRSSLCAMASNDSNGWITRAAKVVVVAEVMN